MTGESAAKPSAEPSTTHLRLRRLDADQARGRRGGPTRGPAAARSARPAFPRPAGARCCAPHARSGGRAASSASAASAAGAAPLRVRSSSAPAITVRAPSRSSSGSSWSGQRAALLDERVDGPQQVGRAQVGVADGVAGRHRLVGQHGQDRVDRPAPVVVGVELAGQDDRATVARGLVDVVGGLLPGERDRAPTAAGRRRRGRGSAASSRRAAGSAPATSSALRGSLAAPSPASTAIPITTSGPALYVVRRNCTGKKWLYVKFDALRSGVPSGKPAVMTSRPTRTSSSANGA